LEDNKQKKEEAMETAAAGLVEQKRIFVPATPGIFRFTVDYGALARGTTADDIAEHFPITGDGMVKFEGHYFKFNHGEKISSEDAVREIEQSDRVNPWSPAQSEHMRSLTPSLLNKERHWIVGLGSVADIAEKKRVLCWRKDSPIPQLIHLSWTGEWNFVFAFLGVRRVLAS
jgi:hypothetical protein